MPYGFVTGNNATAAAMRLFSLRNHEKLAWILLNRYVRK